MKTTENFLAFLFLVCVTFASVVPAQRNGRAPTVNLSVSIDDSATQGGSVGIGSDGNGAYVNGQQSVIAQFQPTGYFEFKSGTRSVNAFYNVPVDTGTPPLPMSDSSTNVQILSFVDSLFLQTMAVGELRCEQMAVNINLGTYARTVGYNAGNGVISNTGKVLFTHPDNNTWIAQTDGAGNCGAFDSIARIRDTLQLKHSSLPTPIDYGRYFMPFRLVLSRQP
jgi:hypothetical protein